MPNQQVILLEMPILTDNDSACIVLSDCSSKVEFSHYSFSSYTCAFQQGHIKTSSCEKGRSEVRCPNSSPAHLPCQQSLFLLESHLCILGRDSLLVRKVHFFSCQVASLNVCWQHSWLREAEQCPPTPPRLVPAVHPTCGCSEQTVVFLFTLSGKK